LTPVYKTNPYPGFFFVLKPKIFKIQESIWYTDGKKEREVGQRGRAP
jgi:hypothetical protein